MKPKKPIESIIRTIRGQKIILDADLAELYGVPTKALNQAVKRNIDRFPTDFLFQLTYEEWLSLRSQSVTANTENVDLQSNTNMWSQIETSSSEVAEGESDMKHRSQIVTGGQNRRSAHYRPYAFTEHGTLQAANVLNSPQAVQMSLFIIRAFLKMREELAANASILKRLAEIDKTLLTHDTALRDVYHKLLPLLSAPAPEKPRRRIGFQADPGEAQSKGKRI